ncbi:hypothetical protein GC098_21715 [Paenibacillus sp. LMG 31458]|uniref:Uncharacterized protein n=1 Tax=Paenibacillus phytorum TaxID=2654977 RepID=A0ABX1Y276_9BACL|nr:hypothetical protein [Paenibacillus phytorum]NOU73984.1 hypothetical protein [Paenibacillus phytorum]
MEKVKPAIDEVIFSIGKLNEVLASTDSRSLELIFSNYPLEAKPWEMFQKLIDWRIMLDSFE